MFGPRKPRCVDFIRQTYSKRYDFFDRSRSCSSTAIDRGIGIDRFGVEKATFDFPEGNIGRASKKKKMFGPRKPRCVDFIRQTYSKRYDFFDRFRSFSSTAIDRGIGIGRFGVEKTTFDFCREMYGAPAKNCSGPENRDASILVGKHIANAMIFSVVFGWLGKVTHYCGLARLIGPLARLAGLAGRAGWLGWVG